VNGVGKGDPANGGYSDYASQGYYSISGSAMTPTDGGGGGESPNTSPVAVIGADKLSGPAPLTVNFSASGSYDPDGDNLSYQWNFGDGATASGANASHTYSAVGNHVATLTVTDSRGASDIAQTTIEVSDPPLAYIHVSNIAMTTVTKRGSTRAYATVSVLDASGKVVEGATVAGNWSGVVSGSSSGMTGRGGTVKLSSPSTTKSGTFTFTITGISIPGYTYDATQNTETSDSITR
jgi:PKD repeat protein